MRRLFLLFLTGVFMIAAGGCGAANANAGKEENEYALYFRERDLTAAQGEDAIRAESTFLEGSEELTALELAEELMKRLLNGPADEGLQSPFPAGTQLLSCKVSGTRAIVDLSSAYRMLSGVALALADCCITLTLTQIPDISSVAVTVRGKLLDYREKQVFKETDILLTSTEDVVASVNAVLYFSNEDGLLTGEERRLDLYEGDTQVQALLTALQDGPQDRNLEPVLPENFSVNFVWLEGDECYINLSSSAQIELPYGQEMRTALSALSRSLCSLKSVREVHYLVDGETAERYCGVWLDNVRASD